jgi:hypothetical protein
MQAPTFAACLLALAMAACTAPSEQATTLTTVTFDGASDVNADVVNQMSVAVQRFPDGQVAGRIVVGDDEVARFAPQNGTLWLSADLDRLLPRLSMPAESTIITFMSVSDDIGLLIKDRRISMLAEPSLPSWLPGGFVPVWCSMFQLSGLDTDTTCPPLPGTQVEQQPGVSTVPFTPQPASAMADVEQAVRAAYLLDVTEMLTLPRPHLVASPEGLAAAAARNPATAVQGTAVTVHPDGRNEATFAGVTVCFDPTSNTMAGGPC